MMQSLHGACMLVVAMQAHGMFRAKSHSQAHAQIQSAIGYLSLTGVSSKAPKLLNLTIRVVILG